MERPQLTERVGFLTNKTAALLIQVVEERLSPLGLTSRPYFVLAGIDQPEPLSQQALSRLLGIDPTTMVGLIDELERSGLVRRVRNTRDRRRYDIELSEAGARTLATAHAAVAAAEEEFFAPLTGAQRADYQDALGRLLDGRWPPP